MLMGKKVCAQCGVTYFDRRRNVDQLDVGLCLYRLSPCVEHTDVVVH